MNAKLEVRWNVDPAVTTKLDFKRPYAQKNKQGILAVIINRNVYSIPTFVALYRSIEA